MLLIECPFVSHNANVLFFQNMGIDNIERHQFFCQDLEELPNIEAKINALKKNPTYRKNKHYLKLLDGSRFMSSMITIPSPDKPSIILRVKRNSQEMKEIRSKYRVSQSEFIMQMDELHVQKSRLQEQLFNDT